MLGYPSLRMGIHDIPPGTRGKKRGLTCATVLRFSRGENYGALITLAAGGLRASGFRGGGIRCVGDNVGRGST